MKRTLIALLALLMAVSLTACGASSRNDMAQAESNMAFDSAANGMDYGWAEKPSMDAPMEAPEAEEVGMSANTAASPLENAKIIYTGELYLQTKNFDSAAQAIDRMVEELGGYYESRNLNQGGSYRSLHATVRVPAENFAAFLDQAGQAAHVTDRYEYNDDVSEAYYDVDSRLATQRTKLERLQELLEKAETMEDIITLESAISETELNIERLTGSLRKYDSLVNFSTITVVLDEVYRLSTDEVPVQTFSQRLNNALTTGLERGIDDLEDFVIDLARNWVSLLILVVIAVPVVLILRRKWRKRRSRAVPTPKNNTDNTQS